MADWNALVESYFLQKKTLTHDIVDTLITEFLDREVGLLQEGKKGVAHPDKMDKVITDKSGNKLTLSAFKNYSTSDIRSIFDEGGSLLADISSFLESHNASGNILYNSSPDLTPEQEKKIKTATVVIATDGTSGYAFIRFGGGATWAEKRFAEQTGYSLSGTQSSKEILAFGPSTLIGSGAEVAFDALPEVVMSNAKGQLPEAFVNSLGPFFESVYASTDPQPLSFDSQEQRDASMSSLEKYFGEIMAPALLGLSHMLTPQPSSALADAAEAFELNWSDRTGVSFPEDANYPLVDSYLHFGERKIGVSSKSKRGANPSVKNFIDLIGDLEGEKSAKLRENGYAAYLDLLSIITQSSSKVGPIKAAMSLNLISPGEAQEAVDYIKNSSVSLSPRLDELSASHGKTKISDVIGNPELSKTNPGYSPANHLIAGIAKSVANKVNKEGIDGKSFTEFAKAVYAFSDMVQIYGKFKTEGELDAKMQSFKIIYPPLFDGTMLLNAGKNYYSSGQKGRLTIEIPPKKSKK